jgi:hypothetical protein
VGCVLLLGGGLVLVRGSSHAAWSVAVCARGPPSSTSNSTSCLSCPVLPRQLWRVMMMSFIVLSETKSNVSWVGFLLRERVLFIGTQYSNLYTAVDTPAEAAWLCVCVCV